MNYRQMGATGFQTSVLGFGAMRLPCKPDGHIDERQSVAMMRWAADHGVNYFDTAYVYNGGESERVLGAALRDGYREKVVIADKMPSFMMQKSEDLDRFFDESLRRLGTDYIDFYLMHDLQAMTWPLMKSLGAVEWFEKQRDAGRIRHIGFSFHDKTDVLEQILDDYDGWEFCQVQHNYMCENVQAGNRGVELVGERGLGLIIMEPLFGGHLAQPTGRMAKAFEGTDVDPVETALNWLWAKPQISLVLSGMSSQAQTEANVAIAESADYDQVSAAQAAAIEQVKAAYAADNPIGCTGCRYCQPCPNGVFIPELFSLYNQAHQLQGPHDWWASNMYGQIKPEHQPEACVECGECEDKCPQHLPIREWLPKVAKFFK